MQVMTSLKERFNLLFIFSLGFFVGGTINWISKIFYPNNVLVNTTYSYINSLFDSGILYSFILISFVVSLVMNYSKSKKLRLKHPYDSALFLTSVEITVMLFGTFASLMFFLFMSFLNDPLFQALTALATFLMMCGNHQRPKLIEKIAGKLAKS